MGTHDPLLILSGEKPRLIAVQLRRSSSRKFAATGAERLNGATSGLAVVESAALYAACNFEKRTNAELPFVAVHSWSNSLPESKSVQESMSRSRSPFDRRMGSSAARTLPLPSVILHGW